MQTTNDIMGRQHPVPEWITSLTARSPENGRRQEMWGGGLLECYSQPHIHVTSQLYGTDNDDFHDVTIYYKSLTNHESNYGWRFGAGTDLINCIYLSCFFFYTSVTKSSVTEALAPFKSLFYFPQRLLENKRLNKQKEKVHCRIWWQKWNLFSSPSCEEHYTGKEGLDMA